MSDEPKDVTYGIEVLRPLTLEQREDALEGAKRLFMGDEIDPKIYASRIPSKFPTWVTAILVIPLIIVLSAAFITSAYRLHQAGSAVFCASVNTVTDATVAYANDPRCSVVGAATVLMAEFGLIVFFFALAVFTQNKLARYVFWGGIALSAAVALIGNAHISVPWEHNSLFAFVETFTPPILVMAIGYLSKELILSSIERRHSIQVAIKEAERVRLDRYHEPEKFGSDWYRIWAVILKDAIYALNVRQRGERHLRAGPRMQALKSISVDDWKWLVKREMIASDFVVTPTEQTETELALAERLTKEKEIPPELLTVFGSLEKFEAAQNANGNGSIEIITASPEAETIGNLPELWENADGTWSARSNLTGKTLGTEFESRSKANQKLYRHNYNFKKRLVKKEVVK